MTKIADPNLHLTLLQSAWDEKLLPPFDGKGATHDDELDTRVRDALLRIPLPASLLAKLKMVVWDGGNDVWRLIWQRWDGESDEFNLTDLSGIEACKNLTELAFTAGTNFTDCSPVASLKKLKSFMDRGAPLKSLTPLLSLPGLEKVDAACLPTPENKSVLVELRKRGVEVIE